MAVFFGLIFIFSLASSIFCIGKPDTIFKLTSISPRKAWIYSSTFAVLFLILFKAAVLKPTIIQESVTINRIETSNSAFLGNIIIPIPEEQIVNSEQPVQSSQTSEISSRKSAM